MSDLNLTFATRISQTRASNGIINNHTRRDKLRDIALTMSTVCRGPAVRMVRLILLW